RRYVHAVQGGRSRAHRCMGPVIAIAALLALAWVFLWLPSRRRQRAHAAMQDDIEPGDEIITAGGIHGVVKEAAEAALRVEIAPGTVGTLDRRAVAAVARELPEEEIPPDSS